MSKFQLQVGDVHYIPLGKENGITPKEGDKRNKYFVILGFNAKGDVIGGIVTNSKVNNNLPSYITDYMMPLFKKDCPFLHYDSFANCSSLKTASASLFNSQSFRGVVPDDTLEMIIGTLKENPSIKAKQLKEFNI